MSVRVRWFLGAVIALPVVAFLGVGVVHDHMHTIHVFSTPRPSELVRHALTGEGVPAAFGFRVDSLSVSPRSGLTHYISGGPAHGDAFYVVEAAGDSTRITVQTRIETSGLVSRSILALEIWMDPLDYSPVQDAIAVHGPVLEGYWAADSTDQVLWVQPDGRMSWAVGGVWLHGLSWSADRSAQPARLSISGFTSGPLEGRTLFGIHELEGDTILRFDAEAGLPDADAWPESFTSSTLTYRRSAQPRTEPILRQQDP